MADPKLQSCYPTRGLYQTLAVAVMCLQEQAATRPLIGDVVTALTYLASQTYDPNAGASQSNRVGPSTPRAREDWKSHGVRFDNHHAIRSPHWPSPDFRHRELFRAPNLAPKLADGGRGDVIGQSGINSDLDESQTPGSQRDNTSHLGKAREVPGISNRNPDRERAVAEAKVWGENWRERKRMKEPSHLDDKICSIHPCEKHVLQIFCHLPLAHHPCMRLCCSFCACPHSHKLYFRSSPLKDLNLLPEQLPIMRSSRFPEFLGSPIMLFF